MAAAAVAIAEACTFVVSLVVAPANDVSTADWFSLNSFSAGPVDYATVFGGVAGGAVFGATLAVIFRSAPLALGVGFAWAGPIENITVESWQTGYHVFRGQLLGSLIQGGTAARRRTRPPHRCGLRRCRGRRTLVLLSRRHVTT